MKSKIRIVSFDSFSSPRARARTGRIIRQSDRLTFQPLAVGQKNSGFMVGRLYDRPAEWFSQTFNHPRPAASLARARVLLHMRPDDPAQQIDAPRVGPIGQGRLIVRGIFQRDRQLSAVDSIGQCNTQRTA